MPATRREFLLTGSLGAIGASCAGSRDALVAGRGTVADARRMEAIERAIEAARRSGAAYVDARIVRKKRERVVVREDHVVAVESDESFGLGVRVIAAGAWGFAATSRVEGPDAEVAAARAVQTARSGAALRRGPVTLAPVRAFRDAWATPMRTDPFQVPLADKVALLLAIWPEARRVAGVKYCTAWFEAIGEHKLFASSEGSRIEQAIVRVGPGYEVTAVDPAGGEFETRRHDIAPMQAGWEYVTSAALVADARRMAEDAARKLRSPAVRPGRRDLVLAPSNLWLTIHESVGHPTELDRALGYEANFAGTSFATPDKLRRLRYAAPIVTLYADKTTPGGLATCGWDDDGVRTGRWDLVTAGVFTGYQTTREQAGWIGENESRGTCYAEDFRSFPFQRMPNVSLAAPPGSEGRTIDDLIAGTDDGVLVTGNGSFSIDHQRYNFQFGGQTFHEIRGGKVVGALRDVAYHSNTVEFWNACDGIGGPASWELHGTLHDGKGEPSQSNPVSHGCPPARFRAVNVLSTNVRRRAPA